MPSSEWVTDYHKSFPARLEQEFSKLKNRQGVSYYDWLASLTTGRVLDVGAGSGTLADCCHDVLGGDLVSSGGSTLLLDGSRLPFADRSFDTVVASLVLPLDTQPCRIASEMERVARKRVVATFGGGPANSGNFEAMLPLCSALMRTGEHYNFRTRASIQELWRTETVVESMYFYFEDRKHSVDFLLAQYELQSLSVAETLELKASWNELPFRRGPDVVIFYVCGNVPMH